MRDLDIDIEESVDAEFVKSIKDITSSIIVKNIKYPNPLHTFTFCKKLTNPQINISRFMMEGLGYSPKYWLCTGVDTLNNLIIYNMKDEHYNILTKVSERKDVLCLYGLPLFYMTESSFGDCLLMVSDVKKTKVRVCCFKFNMIEKNKKLTTKKEHIGKKRIRPYKENKHLKEVVNNLDEDAEDDWEDIY